MKNPPEAERIEEWKQEILDLVIKLLNNTRIASYAQGYADGYDVGFKQGKGKKK